MHKPSAVLWDFDGTLVDTEPVWAEVELAHLARNGVHIRADELFTVAGQSAVISAQQIAAAEGRDDWERVHHEIHEGVAARVRDADLPWNPGVRDLLAAMHADGVEMAVVTASAGRIMQEVAARLPDELRFVIDADQVSQPKPDPEGYHQAMRRLGVTPEQTLILEDSGPGVAAAEASGAVVVALPGTARGVPEHQRRPRVVPLDSGLGDVSWEDLCSIFTKESNT